MAHYGIRTVADQTTTGALEQDLAQGRKVIVALNSEILWNQRGNRSQEDHSVVVTGIDTKAGVVYLNDSGSNTGRGEQVRIAVLKSLGRQAKTSPS
jgi:Peptidase_C39 like family